MKTNRKIIFLMAFIFVLLLCFNNVYANTIPEPSYDMFPKVTTSNPRSTTTSTSSTAINNENSRPGYNGKHNESTNTKINVETSNDQNGKKTEVIPDKQKNELLDIKNQSRTQLDRYNEQYNNNKLYGTIAYVLSLARQFSIPVFIIGILLSVVYEFIIGLKKREMVNKGRGLRITLGVAFVIFQTLPLIFSIVIKFWG